VTRLRVMTYNIWQGGRGGPPLGEVVRAAAPDVLLVNETPKTPLLWRGRCLRLAREWGMEYVVGGRSAGANMILVRAGIEVLASAAMVLPQPPLRPRRGIAAVRLRLGGEALGLVSCHLSLHPRGRRVEVQRVVEVADGLGEAVVVGGDLNERPDGPSWRALLEAGYVDAGSDDWPTYPADAPVRRIDALLVTDGLRVLRHGDPGVEEAAQARASDHRPVLAELEL
jgi:endonuclease/exonuclease/phosphatase family metal-dependent hydrolase